MTRNNVGLLTLFLSAAMATAASAQESMEDQLRAYYPDQALAAGLEGQATLRCRMTSQIVLKSCRLVSEEPAGVGFGQAALKLASLSQPNPKAHLPTRRDAPIRFTFTLNPIAISPNTLRPIAVVKNVDWVRGPTAEDLKGAFPLEATAATGRAVLKCHVSVDQSLDDCSVIEESPPAQGFGRAALGLAAGFRMTPKTYDDEPQGGAPVIIPFAFSR